jgi:cytochrome c-type biogenesis protein
MQSDVRRWSNGRYAFRLKTWRCLAIFAVEPFAAFLARFRAHLGTVKKVMGGLLVLTGIAFLTGFVKIG